MPDVKRLEGVSREGIVTLLGDRRGGIAVELGVAGGGFSKRLVETGRFAEVFGVDMYADTHDVAQYKEALRTVGLHQPYKLLRMTFDQALDLFEDESLDFIYVDGYAHSGQEGGETIWQWARKVKIGGVIAGDDYHPDWPLVCEAVDQFAEANGLTLHVTTKIESGTAYDDYPSWGVIKSAPIDDAPPADLVRRGKAAAENVRRKRMLGHRLVTLVGPLLGKDTVARLQAWNKDRLDRRRARRRAGNGKA